MDNPTKTIANNSEKKKNGNFEIPKKKEDIDKSKRYEFALLNILEDVRLKEEELEKSKEATLNILEDVENAKKEVEIKSENLKKRVNELQILREMGEKIGYAPDLSKVLDTISIFLAKIADYSVVSYTLFDLDAIILNFYLNQSVSLVFIENMRDRIVKVLHDPKIEEKMPFSIITLLNQFNNIAKNGQSKKKNGTGIENIKNGHALKLNLLGKSIDNKNQETINSYFDIPLIIGYELIGIVSIASTKPEHYENEEEVRVISTVSNQAAIAISRLQFLIHSETERMSTLVSSLGDGLVMFNSDYKILIANPASKEIFKLPEEKFDLFEISKLLEKENFHMAIEECLEMGTKTNIEEAGVNNRFFELFVSPVRDYEQKITGGLLSLHDITHRREVERAKTEFVSVASHQLRTPLSAINWFAEIILDGTIGKMNAQQKEYVQQIYDSNKRLTYLVNDLLNVSRIESGGLKMEFRLSQLENVVKGIVDEAKNLANIKKVAISFKSPKTKLPEIYIDSIKIRQALQNIVSNSILYNKENGKVTISLEQKGNKILFTCKDTGIGIPKEYQEKLFVKFFRGVEATKKSTEGSGLGLYIAKTIIESSGGSITFESKEGIGTTFFVTFPIKK